MSARTFLIIGIPAFQKKSRLLVAPFLEVMSKCRIRIRPKPCCEDVDLFKERKQAGPWTRGSCRLDIGLEIHQGLEQFRFSLVHEWARLTTESAENKTICCGPFMAIRRVQSSTLTFLFLAPPALRCTGSRDALQRHHAGTRQAVPAVRPMTGQRLAAFGAFPWMLDIHPEFSPIRTQGG